VDVLGLVIVVTVLAPSVHDSAVGITLLDQVAVTAGGSVSKALVDQGFKNQVVTHRAALGIDVEIVRRHPEERGFVPPPKRWRVEQTFGILILHRRLVRDSEHRPASSASRICWAMTHVMARRLTDTNALTWREPQVAGASTSTPSSRHSTFRKTPPGPWPTISAPRSTPCRPNSTRPNCVWNTSPSPARPSPASPTESRPRAPAQQEVWSCPNTRLPRILAVFNDTTGPLRAQDICQALSFELLPKHVERTRVKMKRLVTLGILSEAEPGTFSKNH
jgi:transposase